MNVVCVRCVSLFVVSCVSVRVYRLLFLVVVLFVVCCV